MKTQHQTKALISHRPGTKAEKVHRFVRIHREQQAQHVIPRIVKKFAVTPGTARNWFQTFKAHPLDLTPSRKTH